MIDLASMDTVPADFLATDIGAEDAARRVDSLQRATAAHARARALDAGRARCQAQRQDAVPACSAGEPGLTDGLDHALRARNASTPPALRPAARFQDNATRSAPSTAGQSSCRRADRVDAAKRDSTRSPLMVAPTAIARTACPASGPRIGPSALRQRRARLAHVGVLKLLERAVPVDVITGTSMGAMVRRPYERA